MKRCDSVPSQNGEGRAACVVTTPPPAPTPRCRPQGPGTESPAPREQSTSGGMPRLRLAQLSCLARGHHAQTGRTPSSFPLSTALHAGPSRHKPGSSSYLSCLRARMSTYTVVGSGPEVPCKQGDSAVSSSLCGRNRGCASYQLVSISLLKPQTKSTKCTIPSKMPANFQSDNLSSERNTLLGLCWTFTQLNYQSHLQK